MSTPIIYVAHPFEGDTSNLDTAEIWCAELSREFDGLFIAPWVPLCRRWPNEGNSLERGLMLDRVAIGACHGVILVGEYVSKGMVDETLGVREARIFSKALRIGGPKLIDEWTAEHLRAWLANLANANPIGNLDPHQSNGGAQ